MTITQVEVRKEMKVGLPNFSNITASCGLTAEVGKGEQVNWDELWDNVNQELSTQITGIEPSWIQTKELGKFFKVTISVPKKEKYGNE